VTGAEPPPKKTVKLAVLAADADFAAEKDLLATEFSKFGEVALLERSEWDKLLREHERTSPNGGSNAFRGTAFAAADSLVILKKFEFKGESYVICKLVDVKRALILDSVVVPEKQENAEFKWLKGAAKRFRRKFAKLADPAKALKTVSVLNFRSDTFSPKALEVERQLKAAVQARLNANPGILLTERENAPEVAFEHALSADDGLRFASASKLVDGGFSIDGDKITLKLRIRGKNVAAKVKTLTGTIAAPGELAEKASLFVEKALDAATDSHWDGKAESEEYSKEAKWAFQNGMFKLSAESSEAAWALGDHSPTIAILRIIAYASQASHGAILKDRLDAFWRQENHLKKNDCSDARFDAAITAISLFNIHILPVVSKLNYRQKREFAKNNLSHYSININCFTGNLLQSLTLPLAAAARFNPSQANSTKARVLRKLLRSVGPRTTPDGGETLEYALFIGASYWRESVAEQRRAYVELMKRRICRRITTKRIYWFLRHPGRSRPSTLFQNLTDGKLDQAAETKTLLAELVKSEDWRVSFQGRILQTAFERPFDPRKICDTLWRYVSEIANPPHNEIFLSQYLVWDLSEDFKCEYALALIENARNGKSVNVSDIRRLLCNVKRFKPKHLERAKKALEKLSKLRMRSYTKRFLLELIGKRLGTDENHLKPTRIWKFDSQPLAIHKISNRAVLVFDETSPEYKKIRLVFKSYAPDNDSPEILFSLPRPFDNMWFHWELLPLAVSAERVMIATGSRLGVFNFASKKWRRWKFPGGAIRGLLMKGDSLWILSTSDPRLGFYENALRKLNLSTGEVVLAVSSRRIPRENVLDGTGLTFVDFRLIDANTILLGAKLDVNSSRDWLRAEKFYLIDTRSNRISELAMRTAFRNGVPLFDQMVLFRRYNSSAILLLDAPKGETLAFGMNELELKEFKLKEKSFTTKRRVYDRRVPHLYIRALIPAIALPNGTKAVPTNFSYDDKAFLLVEKSGVRLVPITFSHLSLLSDPVSGTIGFLATDDGYFITFTLCVKKKKRRYAMAYFSKEDILRAAKRFPLLRYNKTELPAKPVK